MKCSACGNVLNCSGGCYIICVDDCKECRGNCEPPIKKLPEPVFRILRDKGSDTTEISMGGDEQDWKPFPYGSKLQLCFHEVLLSTLAGALSSVMASRVHVAESVKDEKISGEASGTLTEIAAKLSFVVE